MNHAKTNCTKNLLFFSLLLLIAACKKDIRNEPLAPDLSTDARIGSQGFVENDMVLYWNEKANLVLSAGMIQPTRARQFAIIQVAVHDAINSIKPKYERYALKNARQQFASPDAAVASAAFWAIKGLNLQGSFPIDDWYSTSLSQIADGDAKELGKALGKLAAETIINQRSTDGLAQVLQSSPTPANGATPGAYRQTNNIPFRLIPNWGTVMQPWVTTSNYQFRPSGPYAVTSEEYAADYNEVKIKGARMNGSRTSTEEQLARFWAENRPSVIWNNVARAAIADKKMDAWKTARFFALVHTALADGFNTALEANYHFYFWRPETAIHEGNNDGNNATTGDLTWLPFIPEGGPWVTPPVPEYPSGYALSGGVVAELVREIVGTVKNGFEITSATAPGITLSYNSVDQAARDNSVAKINAGWQFRKSVLDGQEMGRRIAGYVLSHAFKPEDD